MKRKPVTIGIFSPIFDGSYYNVLLDHFQKAIQRIGGRIIMVQTDESKRTVRPNYNDSLAFDHVDGWVVLIEALNDRFYHKLRYLGKPVISVSSNYVNYNKQVIRSNNFHGMYEAVCHLLDHGHTEITFVGKLKHTDVYYRYLGYRAALKERNISINPKLTYCVEANLISSGHDGAKMLLEDGVPCTAIVAGCDANAIGIMETLKQAGYRFPDDLAIIGYDDTPVAKTTIPALSTVQVQYGTMVDATLARLFQLMEDPNTAKDTIYIQDRFIIRQSCGCKEMVKEESDSGISENEINIQVLNYMQNVIHTNAMIGKSLIKANSLEVKDLNWLQSTNIKWGCLGLWDANGDTGKRLIIEQVYNNPEGVLSPVGMICRAEEFPPIQFLPDSTHSGGSDVVSLHLIRTEKREWGVLALVGPVETVGSWYNIGGTMTHSFNLLASALEREAMNDALREREKRYRMLVGQLEIVSRTTNNGIWDWNLEKDQIEWNDRIYMMLGLKRGDINDSEMFMRFHPDDLSLFRSLIDEHLKNQMPFETEIRMKHANGTYLWVYIAGEALRDNEGKPIRIIGSVRDITERKNSEEQIVHLAYHDPLTGLYNRAKLLERLQYSIKQAKMNGHKLAVMLMDLDRFKVINDTFGHHTGDRLLQFVANQFISVVDEDMTVARLGGDEFIILMPQLNDVEDAFKLGQRILNVLRVPFVDELREFFVTGSLGISIFPNDGDDGDILIQCADIAMYRAKHNGRNQLELFAPEMNEMALDRLSLENKLRKALDRGEFKLYYQPQIDLHTGKLFGVEALIRWHSPELGIMQPLEFIPIAEETGLIVPIGNWIIQEACSQMKKWRDNGYESVRISINISGRQFKQTDFVGKIKQALESTDLMPEYLCLEITESTVIDNIDFSIKMLMELMKVGVQISIDDFGTGYSSLAILKRLPLNMLKIDKSFIHDITFNKKDEAIVKAIIDMSHSIKLRTVAEGVETEDQLMLLRDQGCDVAQGFLIRKPIPPEQFEQQFLINQGQGACRYRLFNQDANM